MPVDKVRKLIIAIDNNKTEFNTPPFKPFISKRLRKLVGISEPIDNEKKLAEVQQQIEKKIKQANDETKQMNIELKQRMKDELKQMKDELMKDMQELLNSVIKNSNVNNDVKDKTDE